jgi:hypothetical protein
MLDDEERIRKKTREGKRRLARQPEWIEEYS